MPNSSRTMYPMRSESSIQTEVVEYHRSYGGIAVKISTQGSKGSTGYPDFIFLWHGIPPLFIEFKRPMGDIEPHQIERIARLRKAGHTVVIVASVKYGKMELDRWRMGATLRSARKTGMGTK